MNKSFRALANRNYLFVWMGSLLSNIGNWMENVGQGWVVASQTHSAFKVELLSFAQFIPMIFLVIPAGIIADRKNRKSLLLTAQVGMCLCAAVQAAMAHMGFATPNAIILITFFEGAAWALNGPAWHSVLPLLVPRKDMESAISLNSIQYNLARLIGPAVAGVVVASWGFAYAFDINVLSFLAVLAAIAFVSMRPYNAAEKSADSRDFAHAWKWVRSHRGARRILFNVATFAVFSAPIHGLMPYIASDVLHAGPRALGYLLASLGAGAVTGAFLLGQLPSYYPRHHLIPLTMCLFGLFVIFYSQASHQYFALPLLFIVGMFWLSTMVSCTTAIQLLIPDDIRGRVMSLVLIANVGMLPIGHLSAGILAQNFGPGFTLLLAGCGVLCVGLYTLYYRVPEVDGYPPRGQHVRLKNFFSEIILASSHRADALALDQTNPNRKPRPNR